MGSWFVVAMLAWFVELGLCSARAYSWFLSHTERAQYALAALSLAALLIATGALLRCSFLTSCRTRGARRLGTALAAGAYAGWAVFALTEGRLVRAAWWRPWLVAACVAVAAGLGLWLWALVGRMRGSEPPLRRMCFAGCLCLSATALGALDLWLWPRTYPEWHLSLALCAWAAWLVAALVTPEPRWCSGSRVATRAGLLAACLGALGLGLLVFSPNAGFAAEHGAPWTGKLVRLLSQLSDAASTFETDVPESPAPAPPVRPEARVDLRDQDILLVTVDALRADLLAAYGGRLDTPAIDALANEGMVFERAYSPTPHTSYALTSLLTGKPMREVLALDGAARDHVTLPDLLRRYGYRTAAFYPPAIFFVDGARFELLQKRRLGFEYDKRMFATAQQRVAQLKRYLAQVPKGKPLFVWMHLFEPHEPYDPPEGEPLSDSPRHRYEAEVRYIDRALGELVALFRKARPGASVIVSADHGEEFGDHGGYYHGTTLYDEQIRVPLIWSSPGVVAKGRTHAPVELFDVGTALLAAAGVPRDARMRGDALGSVLAGQGGGPEFAFASVEERFMVVDSRYKAVCRKNSRQCRLYDLRADPGERTNLAEREPERMRRLQKALGAHLGSIAHEEVAALAQGVGWPEPLVRAQLGVPDISAELLPLLAHERPEVRAAAARALGQRGFAPARAQLTALARADPSLSVQREAVLASCALGVEDGCTRAARWLKGQGGTLARRAALVLAEAGRASAGAVLLRWAQDEEAPEHDRAQALDLVAKLGSPGAEPVLIELLSDVRLRSVAARALGRVGTKRGANALAQALSVERHPPAREAVARALLRLKDSRATPLIRHLLGTESSLPGGVDMLAESGRWPVPMGDGARFEAGSSALRGEWRCAFGQGCTPREGASVSLPARRRPDCPVRTVWSVYSQQGGTLRLGSDARPVAPGTAQVAFERARAPSRLPVQVEGDLRLRALALVCQAPDIAPPTPEPWNGEAEPAPTP